MLTAFFIGFAEILGWQFLDFWGGRGYFITYKNWFKDSKKIL